MPETLSVGSLPAVFSPLAKALLDGFSEGVVVFDADGKLMYANHQAREALAGMELADAGADLQPRLAAMGGRLRPLRVGALELGEAMFIPGVEGATTLAAREKEAIVKWLNIRNSPGVSAILLMRAGNKPALLRLRRVKQRTNLLSMACWHNWSNDYVPSMANLPAPTERRLRSRHSRQMRKSSVKARLQH
jgi:hypothetical protein